MPTMYSTTPRSTELSGLVQSVWRYQGTAAHAYEQILPSVTSQLLINLHENELRHWTAPGRLCRTIGPVGVQGVLTEPVLIDTAQKRDLCGVAFTRSGLSAFCHVNASRFTNSLVDASNLWGDSAMHLRTALLNSSDPAEQCRIIMHFLEARLTDSTEESALIEKIVDAMAEGTRLSDIRVQFGLSQRGLHKLFDKRIGVRPKIFSRVSRFSGALSAWSGKTGLSEHALDHGYSDQAHFTREFRAFTGTVPTRHQPIAREKHHVKFVANNLFKSSDSD